MKYRGKVALTKKKPDIIDGVRELFKDAKRKKIFNTVNKFLLTKYSFNDFF